MGESGYLSAAGEVSGYNQGTALAVAHQASAFPPLANISTKDNLVKIEMGVWIDRRQAVIVTLLDEKEEIRRIRSNINRHSLYWRASQPQSAIGSRDILAEENRSRQISNRMDGYYDAVLRWLSIAESILIYGSGEGKNELQKRLLQRELSERVVGVRTADMLTAREFALEVRYQFNALSQQPADTKTETE